MEKINKIREDKIKLNDTPDCQSKLCENLNHWACKDTASRKWNEEHGKEDLENLLKNELKLEKKALIKALPGTLAFQAKLTMRNAGILSNKTESSPAFN